MKATIEGKKLLGGENKLIELGYHKRASTKGNETMNATQVNLIAVADAVIESIGLDAIGPWDHRHLPGCGPDITREQFLELVPLVAARLRTRPSDLPIIVASALVGRERHTHHFGGTGFGPTVQLVAGHYEFRSNTEVRHTGPVAVWLGDGWMTMDE